MSINLEDIIIDHLLRYAVIQEYRNSCYLLDDLRSVIMKELGYSEHIMEFYSGSKIEGMMNYGDLGIMFCNVKDFIIIENIDQAPFSSDTGTGILVLEYDRCYHGYTRLLVHKESPNIHQDLYIILNEKKYLSAINYKEYAHNQYYTEKPKAHNHGPAFNSDHPDSIDFVTSLKCLVWPSIARADFIDHQTSDTECYNECFLVPVAHPKSKYAEIEFRFSFSAVEKFVIRNWSEQQIKCYFLLKELFKTYFSQNCEEIQKGLCSYFAKTAVFWATEKNGNQFWTDNSISTCTKIILLLVKQYLEERSCPNYFIPKNLMLSDLSDEEVSLLTRKLESVENNFMIHILQCQYIKLFFGCEYDSFLSLFKMLPKLDHEKSEEIFHLIFEKGNHFDFWNEYSQPLAVRRSLIDFTSFCMRFENSQNILTHISEHLESLVLKNFSPVLLHYFRVCLQRSAAMHWLSSNISSKIRADQCASSIHAQGLLTMSVRIPGNLDDEGATGFVYLGLSYYVTGQKDKAFMFLQHAIGNSFKKLARLITIPHMHFLLPVIICTRSVKHVPNILQEDDTLCELFQKRHLHTLFIDPLVLALYLKYRISGDKIHLEKYHELAGLFLSLKQQSHDYIAHSLFESYAYIGQKYNLFGVKLENFKLGDPKCPHTCFARKRNPLPPQPFLVPDYWTSYM